MTIVVTNSFLDLKKSIELNGKVYPESIFYVELESNDPEGLPVSGFTSDSLAVQGRFEVARGYQRGDKKGHISFHLRAAADRINPLVWAELILIGIPIDVPTIHLPVKVDTRELEARIAIVDAAGIEVKKSGPEPIVKKEEFEEDTKAPETQGGGFGIPGVGAYAGGTWNLIEKPKLDSPFDQVKATVAELVERSNEQSKVISEVLKQLGDLVS